MSALNKKFIILVAILLAVSLGVFLIILLTSEKPVNKDEFLIERTGETKEAWPRIITEDPTGENKKVLINMYDGYKITVPATWQTLNQEDTVNAARLPVYTRDIIQNTANTLGVDAREISDFDLFEIHPVLAIQSLPQKNKELTDWIKENSVLFNPEARKFTLTQVNTYPAYKTSAVKLMGDEGIIENSLEVSYILESPAKDKVYILTCTAESENYLEQRIECEKSVQSFEFI